MILSRGARASTLYDQEEREVGKEGRLMGKQSGRVASPEKKMILCTGYVGDNRVGRDVVM